MRRTLVSTLGVVVTLGLCLSTGWGQSLSTLRGTVTDPSGAVVPGVEVTVEDQDASVKVRTISTDSQGNYEMPDLKQGRYRLKAVKAGFATYQVNDAMLASDQNKRVDIQLQIGETGTKVDVSGAAATIDTEDAKIGGEDLPDLRADQVQFHHHDFQPV